MKNCRPGMSNWSRFELLSRGRSHKVFDLFPDTFAAVLTVVFQHDKAFADCTRASCMRRQTEEARRYSQEDKSRRRRVLSTETPLAGNENCITDFGCPCPTKLMRIFHQSQLVRLRKGCEHSGRSGCHCASTVVLTRYVDMRSDWMRVGRCGTRSLPRN